MSCDVEAVLSDCELPRLHTLDERIDSTIGTLKRCAAAGKWGAAHVEMRLRGRTLMNSSRPDVVEFLREFDPLLDAARLRSAEDGWHLPSNPKIIWQAPATRVS